MLASLLMLSLAAMAAPDDDDPAVDPVDAAQTAVDVGTEVAGHLAEDGAPAAGHADDVVVPALPHAGDVVVPIADHADDVVVPVLEHADDAVRVGATAAEGASVAARGVGQAASHADDLLKLVGLGAAGAVGAAGAAASKRKDP